MRLQRGARTLLRNGRRTWPLGVAPCTGLGSCLYPKEKVSWMQAFIKLRRSVITWMLSHDSVLPTTHPSLLSSTGLTLTHPKPRLSERPALVTADWMAAACCGSTSPRIRVVYVPLPMRLGCTLRQQCLASETAFSILSAELENIIKENKRRFQFLN